MGVCTTTSDDARGSVAATVESFATVEFKDYYETLGVARDAPADAIKKAYRKLARKYHPDVSKEPDAGTRMAAINEAHTVLSDPEKRAAYDQLGRHAPGQDFRPPPGWDEGMEFTERRGGPESAEFSEFFSEIFGRMGREGVHARARAADGSATYPGNDHHARILLDLEDSFAGATRQVTLRAPRLDPKGYVVLEERTLSVGIPAGIREGQVIRLAGQGEPGIGNGKPGDLLLEVQFRPHARERGGGEAPFDVGRAAGGDQALAHAHHQPFALQRAHRAQLFQREQVGRLAGRVVAFAHGTSLRASKPVSFASAS